MTLVALSGGWYGDFWEHAAVVRELSARPFAPSHPQLLLDSPHAFYSPYALLVAVSARLLDTDPMTALAIAGIVNLLLLLIGLRAFAGSLSRDNADRAAFYALILVLFWWGPNTWEWSGFFHIGVIGFVLPYPSACAVAVTLLTLSLYRRRQQRMVPWHHLLLVLATGFVLLTHPYTFLFLATGYAGLALGAPAHRGRELLRVTAVLAAGILLAIPWPHFPLLALLFKEASAYHQGPTDLYSLASAWPIPALLILLLVSRLPRPMLGPVITLTLLAAVYVYGAVMERWAYGRVMSGITLMVFLLAAERLVASEVWLRRRATPNAAAVVPLGVLLVSVVLSWRPVWATLAQAAPPWTDFQKEYAIMAAVDEQDVVMAELPDGWRLPALSGRIVASNHALAFVPDHERRRWDIARFFDPHSSPTLRRLLIEKYRVEFVLVRNAARARLPAAPAMNVIEDPVAANATFTLYRVRDTDR